MDRYIDASSEKVKEEEKHLKGEKRLSSDHKSYKDLYENMGADQELKLKKLLKEQQLLKENFSTDVKQSHLFTNLINLLKFKMEVVQKE